MDSANAQGRKAILLSTSPLLGALRGDQMDTFRVSSEFPALVH